MLCSPLTSCEENVDFVVNSGVFSTWCVLSFQMFAYCKVKNMKSFEAMLGIKCSKKKFRKATATRRDRSDIQARAFRYLFEIANSAPSGFKIMWQTITPITCPSSTTSATVAKRHKSASKIIEIANNPHFYVAYCLWHLDCEKYRRLIKIIAK